MIFFKFNYFDILLKRNFRVYYFYQRKAFSSISQYYIPNAYLDFLIVKLLCKLQDLVSNRNIL